MILNNIDFLSVCCSIPRKLDNSLTHLDFFIIDCLINKPHPSHLNLEGALDAAKRLGPKKTILTNLHVDLDYNLLKKKLPSNIIPAFDGMSFTF